jgi:methylmalonyl-CoA/ethylmalonyl-CoA epimerase
MFTRVHHVSIVVRSLELAVPFYRDVLGLCPEAPATLADQGVRAVLFPLHDGEIELLQPADPAGGVARFLERRGEGAHHICLETPDISAALAHAKAAGLSLIDQSPRPGLAGMIAFLHPKASHGVLVEFAQPLGPSAHPAASDGGLQIVGIGTVYAVVSDLAVAAATFARNFRGRPGAVQESPHFGARQVVVSIGGGRIGLLRPEDRASPAGCFLAGWGEGLFGVSLRVADMDAALRHLEATGVATEVFRRGPTIPLARLDPARANGVNLFVCADTPEALR